MRLVWVLWASLATAAAWGSTCPEKIRYTNGAYLKNGDRYSYPNGTPAIRDARRLHYPNGSVLMNGDRVYYPNGVSLQNGDRLYYPSGTVLKNGDRYYYANGVPFKNGDTFYYRNGNPARRNGKLYRENGTPTVFPVELSEAVGTVGTLWAQVSATEETVAVAFDSPLMNEPQVRVRALWDSVAFAEFVVRLNTGAAGENVIVRLADGAMECELAQDTGPGDVFSVHGRAGHARVRVHSGHDAEAIKGAIENALNRF